MIYDKPYYSKKALFLNIFSLFSNNMGEISQV